MKIVTLMENTPGQADCLFEHGLSIYVETAKHKLLVDTGASDKFLNNAEILGVDLQEADTLILSHGHYDHAGGILPFALRNDKADIYLQKSAMDAFYHKDEEQERYIGIAPEISKLPKVKLMEGNYRIDEELFLFTGVTKRRLWPSGNKVLKIKRGDEFIQDEFIHEQYLVIEEDSKRVLISGCAHNGILNILDKFRELYNTWPDAVISGFHLKKKSGYTQEDLDNIRQIAEELSKLPTKFYTGHCTGEEPYGMMKEIMGEQLIYLHSGDKIYSL
ncbi:MAG: MBL fold metallo-hydrolase [Lachnospiraceae bacterium]|nr:MBL fold metallo-hydrolase [Lachnospiraceae bacterium]